MQKMPYLEINCIPSKLNTSPATGVASQLSQVAEKKPNFDGMTIDLMRGNPLFERIDDIDKVGLAQKQIISHTNTLKSNAKRIRAFNDAATKISKPK